MISPTCRSSQLNEASNDLRESVDKLQGNSEEERENCCASRRLVRLDRLENVSGLALFSPHLEHPAHSPHPSSNTLLTRI